MDPQPVRVMAQALVHRGPDAGGLFHRPGIAAAVRRLRVIDVHGGDQPMTNEDGSVHVVFNGEIYNHRELRRELSLSGHRFRTRADTEVLVHLWEDHGARLVERLDGMFAFCIHDARTGETFLARDRLGIKPLYWTRAGDALVFASESAAFKRHGGLALEIDPEALAELYCLQYVTGDRSVHRNVRKLLPGHAIRIANGEARVTRWYEPPQETETGPDPAGRLRELLEDSVRQRRIADVPIGVFLSGGLDSAAVTATLRRVADEPVTTFSMGFESDAAFDERRWARQVSRGLGTEHHEMVVSPVEIARELPGLVRHLGEPVMDPALIPTYLLSRFARERVTVVLTGEGADELFAGYRRYLYQNRYGWLARVPALARAGGLALNGLLPGRAGQGLDAVGQRDPAGNHLRWSMILDRRLASRLFDRELYDACERRMTEAMRPYFVGDRVRLADQLRADRHEWLPHNLLSKVDRATMAVSLEARVPFLDHRLVEWASGLPDSSRIDGRRTKAVLREAFRDALPQEVLQRPKRGFDLPLAEWIRGPLRELAIDLLRPQRLACWPGLDSGTATTMLDRHLTGRRDYGLPLFNLLSMTLFLEER